MPGRMLFLLVTALASPVQAQDTTAGQALYGRFCATCHGPDGRGNGPTAAVISASPADLTQLASGNGGVFPTERVAARIDGRDTVIAHGSPMPIYGAFFDGAARVQIDTEDTADLFGEDQARYLVTCSFDQAEALMIAAGQIGVPVATVGRYSGDMVRFGTSEAPLAELRDVFRNSFAAAVA